MSFGDVIAVIIGIIFIWALLGVAVMQIQEWIVGWLSLRADSLEDAIWGMLTAPKPRKGPWGRFWEQVRRRSWNRRGRAKLETKTPQLVGRFYSHPLLRSLEQDRAKPSYIPCDTFAVVLLDTVMINGLEAPAIKRALEELEELWQGHEGLRSRVQTLLHQVDEELLQSPEGWLALRQGLEVLASSVKGLEVEEEGVAPMDMLEAALRAQLPREADDVVAALERGTEMLLAESPLLRQRLELLLRQASLNAQDAHEQLRALRRQAGQWFDDTMDQVTGWYKRNRQWGAFAIGLIIAAILNLDTFQIGTALWRQPALRETVLVAARQELESEPADPQAAEPAAAVAQLETTLAELSLPIGWRFVPAPEYDATFQACRLFPRTGEVGGIAWNGLCVRWEDPPQSWGILTKLAGIFITAAAAMQGAPFWFDLLDKIVPIRAAGVRPVRQEDGGGQ